MVMRFRKKKEPQPVVVRFDVGSFSAEIGQRMRVHEKVQHDLDGQARHSGIYQLLQGEVESLEASLNEAIEAFANHKHLKNGRIRKTRAK